MALRGVPYHHTRAAYRAPGRIPLGIAPVVERALPDLPSQKYTSLYTTGNDLRDVVAKMNPFTMLELPSGFDQELSDFSMAGLYMLYSGNLRGFYGPGKREARLRLKRMSSTMGGKVQNQNTRLDAFGVSGTTNQLALARIGKFQGTNAERQTVIAGLCIEGTGQPIANHANPNRGHMYNGLMNYGGYNSFLQDLLIRGVPGDWNSPPGETFQLNNYRDRFTTIRDVEVDGFDPDGERVGGSSSGGNNSIGQVIEDCYFHDSRVSSLTWSFSGSHTDPGAASSDITTRRVWVKNNANWQLAGGQRFTGFNHENAMGFVRHYSPRIELNSIAGQEWNATHMAFNSHLADNTDIEVHDPIVSGGPARNNGCFTVQINTNYAGVPNGQKTPPKVFKNGVRLQPYYITGNPPTTIPVSPDTHFVVTVNPN